MLSARLLSGVRPRVALSLSRASRSPAGSRALSTANSGSRPVAQLALGGGALVAGWFANDWLGQSEKKSASSKPGQEVPQLDLSVPALAYVPPLDEEAVTSRLNEDAYSFKLASTPGVSRYDGAQLASNSPVEDRYIHGQVRDPLGTGGKGADWMAWGIFDGHAGSATAELMTTHLMPEVVRQLRSVASAAGGGALPDEVINKAISDAFISFDDSLIKTAVESSANGAPVAERLAQLMPGFAGSCALLSLYDPQSQMLRVACVGDSRAVLGQNVDGKWTATALSEDQTGETESEIARVEKEHPGEKEIFKKGRLLGIMVSRGFGDGRWKWSKDFIDDTAKKYKGPRALNDRFPALTPPYLTAEPVITTTKIDPAKKPFLILASDGIWNVMSNEQAVDLVGKWVDWQASGKPPAKNSGEAHEPVNFSDYSWQVEEKKFTVQDENPAVHLMRNALGGKHHDLVSTMLTIKSPASRDVRDDLTVQVVFFK